MSPLLITFCTLWVILAVGDDFPRNLLTPGNSFFREFPMSAEEQRSGCLQTKNVGLNLSLEFVVFKYKLYIVIN